MAVSNLFPIQGKKEANCVHSFDEAWEDDQKTRGEKKYRFLCNLFYGRNKSKF